VVDKAREGASSCSSREESQFSIADDLEWLVSYLEFTPAAAIVAAGAEADIETTIFDVLSYSPVACTVERPAVALISASGEHKSSTAGSPRLHDDHVASDRDDSIVGEE
jgi:hypothetical protein